MEEQQIREILVQGNYVSAEDMKAADTAVQKTDLNYVDYFLSQGLLNKDLVGQAIAEYYQVPYADLNSNIPSAEQVKKIPEEIAKNFRVVLFKEMDQECIVTSDVPNKEGLKAAIEQVLQKQVTINYSLSEDIKEQFKHYRKALATRFSEIIKKKKRVAPEIIEEIFEDALTFRASDVHFEPQEKEVVIRFRIDGVLFEAGRIPKEYYENILNRIKVQGQLRIDEHLSAQDGAIRYTKNGKDIDMRISIAPTLNGEKISVRLLAHYVRSFTLGDLGLSEANQKLLAAAAKKPFGMILVTGPTGSGKSTTLYALIKILNNSEVNITTIEDPAEYKIAGINQIQVNTQTNLTFARGLRSIVRQDPDIILVGEIRDEETAEIAVNAALTGHLLFSTFHANDAATTIPRLLDMNIEPFLLASTLEVVVAQRLVRTLCQTCRYSTAVQQEEIEKIIPNAKKYFPEQSATLYKSKGCNNCGHSGFTGRTAIFEFIEVTPEMQELILQNPSTQQIWELAQKQGARSLFEDGIEKVKKGVTTLEELTRVAAPPHFKKL